MFITELMKIPHLALSLKSNVILKAQATTFSITAGEVEYPINQKTFEVLTWIQEKKCPSLMAIRKVIPTQEGNHHLILFIANLLTWNYADLHIIDDNGEPLFAIENASYGGKSLQVAAASEVEEGCFISSRFVLMNREEQQITLTRPMQDKRFIVQEKSMSRLIFELYSGTTLEDCYALYDSSMHASIRLLLQILLAAQFIIHIEDTEQAPSRIDEGSEVDVQWSNVDLLFHSSSRTGYHFGDFGGAFPFINRIEPRTAIREVPEGEVIDLYQPDINELMKNDPSLSQLQMQRLSIRQYDEEKPISHQQIGEFLFRTGRILFEAQTQVTSVHDETQQSMMELAWRPYPTGGASYELELYLTVDRAQGLAPGMYYYAPKKHQLIKLSDANQHTEALIETAYVSCAKFVRPQVLIHVASRFQRVSWKYHAIAYATNLRNTGVLYQTFYLNAIAMGLAPCGLGSGNIKLFADATGLDPLVEGNIGEFMLGSLPQGWDINSITQEDIKRQYGAVNAGKN